MEKCFYLAIFRHDVNVIVMNEALVILDHVRAVEARQDLLLSQDLSHLVAVSAREIDHFDRFS